VERLRPRDHDRGNQDLVSDLGARDLARDGVRRDLLEDRGVQDLARDLGVVDSVRLGAYVVGQEPLTRVVPSGSLAISGGYAATRRRG
jgi:hypothetical protein